MTEPIKVTFIADDKGVVTTTKEIEAAQKEFSKNTTARANSYMALEKQKSAALKQSAKEQAAAEKEIQDEWKSSMATLAKYTAAAVAVGAALKKAFEFGEQGAQIQRLENSFEMMTKSVGADAEKMMSALDGAAQGTIASTDLILTANKAMMLGVTNDADEMARLLEIAAFRGRAMGLSTEQAFGDIATGIGRVSPLILDNLGIVTKGKDIYGKYAETLGKVESELTGVEQKQALLNFVLEEGNAQLEQAGGLALDDAGKFERFRATLKDTANEGKQNLTPAMAGLADVSTNYLDAAQRVNDTTETWMKFVPGLTQSWIALEMIFGEAETTTMKLTDAQIEAAAATSSFDKSLNNYRNTVSEATMGTSALVSEFGGLLSITQSVSKDVQRLRDQEQGLREDFANGKISLEEMNAALQENAAQFEESTNVRILKRAEEMLAADGLTIQEEEALLQRGLAMGVYTQEYVDNANTIIRESQSLANAINAIPSSKTINVSASWSTGAIANAANWDPSQYHRADGGPVSANTPYIVGERGPEMFVPSSSGEIVPNNQLTQGGGNADIINAIQATRINEKTLARTIVTALQQAGA